MKICLYYRPREKNDNFEGARLKENIRQSLELNNIEYALNLIDQYELIHFISLDDEKKIYDSLSEGLPVVFSALYGEMDETVRILPLNQKKINVLNSVDAILVSDDYCLQLLKKQGVSKPIYIVSPGVDVSRFKLKSPLEENIFYNYYQLEKDSKFVVAVGSYENKFVLRQLEEIAKNVPQYKFFFFGKGKISRTSKLSLQSPKNLKFCPLANDEIYASMMNKASIYLSIENNYHSPLTLLDAGASKTQIIALAPLKSNNEILEKLHAYVAQSEEEVIKLIVKYMNGKIKSNVEEAYNFAKANSIKKTGTNLKKIYQKLIDRSKDYD